MNDIPKLALLTAVALFWGYLIYHLGYIVAIIHLTASIWLLIYKDKYNKQ